MTERDPRKRTRTWSTGVLLVLVLSAITPALLRGQAPPGQSTEEGQQLFQVQCAACHTIGGGARIGPDLEGVTERRDLAWLKRWIREPDRMLAERDTAAVTMVARYTIPMPNLGLTEQEVDVLVTYLGTTRKAPMTIPAPFVPTLVLGGLAAVVLTLMALTAGTKRVEIRP